MRTIIHNVIIDGQKNFIINPHSQSHTMIYPKKPGLNQYQRRYWAYITYCLKTWFFKISLYQIYVHLYIYNSKNKLC